MDKLTFYIPSFEGGGAERVASVLINSWSKDKRYNISVINTLPETTDFYTIDKSVPRIFLNYNYNTKSLIGSALEKIKRLMDLREAIKNTDANIIISFMSSPSLTVLLASVGLRKKIICCEHTNYYRFGNKIKRQVRNLLYYLLATEVTVLTKRDLYSYPFYLRSKTTVLPNPLGIEGFKSKKNSINYKQIELLFVGRLTKVKGIERLCKIINNTQTQNWHLTICGDGELKEYVESFVKTNNLTDKVTIMGAVRNIEDFYSTADLLLVTSLKEGLPMVIAEAMSFGLPVLAFDCPTGPREFIQNESNGILVADNEIEQYITELEKLLEDPELLEKLSMNSKNSVQSYSISSINQKWFKILSSL